MWSTTTINQWPVLTCHLISGPLLPIPAYNTISNLFYNGFSPSFTICKCWHLTHTSQRKKGTQPVYCIIFYYHHFFCVSIVATEGKVNFNVSYHIVILAVLHVISIVLPSKTCWIHSLHKTFSSVFLRACALYTNVYPFWSRCPTGLTGAYDLIALYAHEHHAICTIVYVLEDNQNCAKLAPHSVRLISIVPTKAF